MDHIISYLKSKLFYLEKKYGFEIIEEFKANTYFFINWSNKIKNIKVIYEFTDNNPIGIYVYDADDEFMYHYQYFQKEFIINSLNNNYENYREKIDFATIKLKDMIEKKVICI